MCQAAQPGASLLRLADSETLRTSDDKMQETRPARLAGTAAIVACGFLGLLAVATPAPLQAQTVPSPLPLAWCLERAQTANPQLAAEVAASRAAAARVEQAGALDDPRIAYEASNIPVGDFDFRSTPLSGHQLGIRQKLPFPGLLTNRREGARAAAEATALTVEDRTLLTDAAVESAWAELGFAQRALDITDRNIELLRQLSSIAETKYRVGTGLQQDVLRAQVELTVLLEERLRREASIESAGAHLIALLDMPPEIDLPRTGLLEDPARLPALEPLLSELEQRSPRLRALSQRVEQARRLVRVAELEGYPDFDLGLGYRVRKRVSGDPVAGDDFLGAGVTIRVPLFRAKWRARVVERKALLRRQEANHRGARAQIAARIRSTFAALVRANSAAALLSTGLVPQAEQSLQSSRSGYEVGRIDFPSLLDSQVRLLNAELRRVRAIADRRRAFSALEAASGEKLR